MNEMHPFETQHYGIQFKMLRMVESVSYLLASNTDRLI